MFLTVWFRNCFGKLPPPQINVPPGPVADEPSRKPAPVTPLGFDQIYRAAAVKPPAIVYGIQKVTEMAKSHYLSGMPSEHRRKALLMALQAAGTNEGEVLNDLVIRQRALKEYEDSLHQRVGEFETAYLEQNRLHQAEFDRITAQFKARIQENLDEVEKCHRDFRSWQEAKRLELQRYTETANLCVPPDVAEEEPQVSSNVTPMLRPTGTFR